MIIDTTTEDKVQIKMKKSVSPNMEFTTGNIPKINAFNGKI